MHPNRIFRQASRDQNIAFARQRSFGVLVVATDDAPLISHIPFKMSDDGEFLHAHLMRSNPIVRHLQTPLNATMVVSGPDAYISPDWYGIDNQVPTWNYVAVHLSGKLELLDEAQLRGVLDELSDEMESRLSPKPLWKLDKVDKEALERMSRQIVPVVMKISNIEGTWKLSQNKPAEARTGAAQGVSDAQLGVGVAEMARLMKEVEE